MSTHPAAPTASTAAAALEPSAEAIAILQERLRNLGFLLTEAAARDVLRTVLGIEGARLNRRLREDIATRLQSIQHAADAALAALHIEPAAAAPAAAAGARPVSPPPPPQAPAPPAPPPAPQAAPRPAAPAASAAATVAGPAAPRRGDAGHVPVSPDGDEPANLTEIVRRRLGNDLPADTPATRPDDRFEPIEPRRPVFKRPRLR